MTDATSRLAVAYLSLFVLFYRVSAKQWSAGVNAFKGVLGTIAVQVMIIVSLAGLISVMIGSPLQSGSMRWLSALSVPLWLVNQHFLVSRRIGVKFEERSRTFDKSERDALQNWGLCQVGLAWAIFMLSTYTYQWFFNIH
jgi:hypothetical protein